MRPFPGAEKAHTLQQCPISHASRRKNDLLPGRQIVCIVNLLRILDSHGRQTIEHFFRRYKELEEKKTETRGFGNRAEAETIIVAARERAGVGR